MATTIKIIANGFLGTGLSPAVYTPTGTKSAFVTGITFMNTHASAQAVTWYVLPGGVSSSEARIYFNSSIAQNAGDKINDVITLSGADQLVGTATNTSAVSFAVYGIERD
ncbi:MAG: hypothetical protein JNN07_25535 [Verrucomicrobiales bacterium]|nr:hypothetical protein [Verrucomicrobiales bacterium]